MQLTTFQPYVSCFGSALESEAFRVAADDLRLNLPANFTAFGSYLPLDFKRQINVISAYLTTSGKHCIERSGDILPYLGTSLVRGFRRSHTNEQHLKALNLSPET